MAVFVTGDIHADPSRLSSKLWSRGRQLTKDDYVIVLGAFGLVWDWKGESKYEQHWLDWLDNKPWTTLFIDGNHENFDRLEKYPIDNWHGGKVHFICPSVIHLMRGQIFDICGKTFFTMGGAPSHDIKDGVLEIDDLRIKKWRYDRTKLFRINHISWWEQEIPSEKEWTEARINLTKADNKVDFVLTHEAPAGLVPFVGIFPPTDMSKKLDDLRCDIDYGHWYFGHYHLTKWINDKDTCLYTFIQQIA